MKITFQNIEFSAFKDGEPVRMDFVDGINTIVGANGSGKTTVLDALVWCLFGKDFINRTRFLMVPLNPDGSVQKADPCVTLNIVVDGDPYKLTRKLDGSKTVTEINDVPCKTLEAYNDFIAQIFGDEQRFKMFTMPLYFTESLSWQDQRALLMEFFQNPAPEKVFDRMKSEKIRFSDELVEAMKTKTPAGYIDMHNQALKIVERRRDEINAQIKLLDSQLEGHQAIDQSELESERKKLREKIGTLNKKIEEATASNRAILVGKQENESIIRNAQDEIEQILLQTKAEYRRELDMRIVELSRKQDRRQELINDYNRQSVAIETACPMCKQTLPAAEINAAKARQAETLKKISEQGAALKAEIDALEKTIEETQASDARLNDAGRSRVSQLEDDIKAAQARLQVMPGVKEVPIMDPAMQDRLDEIDRALARIDVHRENIKRKSDLEKEVRQLGQEYEQHTIAVNEASKFAFYRSTMVIEAVNAHFKTISVKVLEMQKNGVAKETFEITLNGVPYSGLNKTGKLIASLELMDFLKNSLKVESPVIIDDIENYPDLDLKTIKGQLIVAFAKKRYPLQVINKYPQEI